MPKNRHETNVVEQFMAAATLPSGAGEELDARIARLIERLCLAATAHAKGCGRKSATLEDLASAAARFAETVK